MLEQTTRQPEPARPASQPLHAESEALAAVPAGVAWRWHALPLRVARDELTVALVDTGNVLALDDLRAASGRKVRPVTAPAELIEAELRRHYGQPAPPSTGARRSAQQPRGATQAGPARTVTPRPAPSGGSAASFLAKVRPRERSIFFSELTAMLNAGVSLFTALDTMAGTIRPVRLAQIVRELSRTVQSGKRLSDALRRYPEAFSPLIVGIMAAGEAGGFLVEACRRCAEYSDREHTLQQKIKRETWYPKLVFAAFLIIPTVPTLILQGFGAWSASILKMVAYAAPFVIGAGAVWFGTKSASRSQSFRELLDRIKLRLPLFGKVASRLAFARFSRAMSAIYSAGLGFVRGLPYAADATGNEAIADHLRRSIPRVEGGEPLSDILEDSRLVPPMVIQMVRTGEQTGDIDGMLDKVADYFEQEADTAIHQMTVSLTPICILLLAVIVGMKVIAFYTGALYNFDGLM